MNKQLKILKFMIMRLYLWKTKWMKRLVMFGNTHDKSLDLMRSSNPMVIPRNHKVEEALTVANNGDLDVMNKLTEILKNPYQVNQNDLELSPLLLIVM